MFFFGWRRLTEVSSMEAQSRVREALANAGIACSVRAHGTARAMERRRRMGGTPERDDITYSVYVRKDAYDRAAGALRAMGRGG